VVQHGPKTPRNGDPYYRTTRAPEKRRIPADSDSLEAPRSFSLAAAARMFDNRFIAYLSYPEL
jgi:hypothetical protein